VKKEGPSLDLPIAVGLLRATNFIKGDRHRDYLIAGELALDGRVRRINGGSARPADGLQARTPRRSG